MTTNEALKTHARQYGQPLKGVLLEAVADLEEQAAEIASLKALSVTNILIDIVPGDGSGQEVYAKSVADVVELLSRLSEKAEDSDSLKAQLAEREAENLKIRELLIRYRTETPAGHQPHMICHVVDEALSTPPSTSYLEQWEKEKYGEPVAWLATSRFMLDSYTKRKTNYVNSNDIVQTPLYARKEATYDPVPHWDFQEVEEEA